MTNLEEVLAEKWRAMKTDIVHDALSVGFFWSKDETEADQLRAAAAVLGKRALALVLKHEYADDGHCPECGLAKYHPMGGAEATEHPDCEWGRIVQEAKALG